MSPQLRSIRVYGDALPGTTDYAAISAEVQRAYEKFGPQTRTLFQWVAYITEDLGKLAEAVTDYEHDRLGSLHDVYTEASHVAAIAAHIMAITDRAITELDEPA